MFDDDTEGFGSYLQFLGITLVEWLPDYVVFQLKIDSQKHLNRSGVIHGGVLLSLIDTACGFSGVYDANSESPLRAATLSLATNFVAPISGGTLHAVGRKRGGGENIFFASAEVTNQMGEIVGIGEGSFRYRKNSAKLHKEANQLQEA